MKHPHYGKPRLCNTESVAGLQEPLYNIARRKMISQFLESGEGLHDCDHNTDKRAKR